MGRHPKPVTHPEVTTIYIFGPSHSPRQPGPAYSSVAGEQRACVRRNRLEPDIRHTVLGNAGTLISFRLGPEDASLIAREFEPYIDHLDLMNHLNHEIYIKLMIDGTRPARSAQQRSAHASFRTATRKVRHAPHVRCLYKLSLK
jgi:hypothetical protein